jgi:hypothetical protein
VQRGFNGQTKEHGRGELDFNKNLLPNRSLTGHHLYDVVYSRKSGAGAERESM